MIIPAPICTTPHAYHPPRLGHLVVALTDSWRDLVGDGARDDHHVGLAWRGAEDDAEPVLVVARHGEVHHFDGTAGEAEAEGPEGGLPGPVDELVGGGAGMEGQFDGLFGDSEGTYRTCSMTLVLLRIVVGVVDVDEEYWRREW